jgi:O-acetylserine/cysteine efflux transporter
LLVRGTLGGVNRRDTALAALVAALWGFNFVVIGWGMGTVPPLLFAAIRFTVVAVPACFLVPRPPVPFRTVAAVGTFMSLGQFGLLYLSMHLGMPPGLAALVLQAQVPFTIGIAAAVLREPPSRSQVAGVALGAAGLAVVALGLGGRVSAAALVLCLLAGLSWGIGNVVSRGAKAPGGLALTVWSATVVPVPLLGLSLLTDGPSAVGQGLAHLGWHGALSTVYTAGLCSLVGYAVFNRLLSRYPSGQVVPWVLLAPVVAMAASRALLGESPGPAELAGAVLLVAGVLIAQGTLRLHGAARARRGRTRRPAGAGGVPGAERAACPAAAAVCSGGQRPRPVVPGARPRRLLWSAPPLADAGRHRAAEHRPVACHRALRCRPAANATISSRPGR